MRLCSETVDMSALVQPTESSFLLGRTDSGDAVSYNIVHDCVERGWRWMKHPA